jgi:hypothetical protein
MMQLLSLGSKQSSSLTLLVSLYQSGKPLASSSGPTCFRPTVWLLCAGGGVAAADAITPVAANESAATATVMLLAAPARTPWDREVGKT